MEDDINPNPQPRRRRSQAPEPKSYPIGKVLMWIAVAAAPVLLCLWFFGVEQRSIRDLNSNKRYKRAISAWRLGQMRSSSGRAIRGLINLLDDDNRIVQRIALDSLKLIARQTTRLRTRKAIEQAIGGR